MTKRKSVYLDGRHYKILFKKRTDLQPAYAGRILYAEGRITIASDIPSRSRKEIVIHEIMHAIATNRGVTLKEEKLNALAIGVYAFLVQNRRLVNWISKK